MEFVGRADELAGLEAELEQLRRGDRGRFAWIRGRRRVGKSRLVQEFCDRSESRYCFFQASKRPRAEAVAEFEEAVRESSLRAAEDFAGASHSSWPAALRAAARGATTADPAIIVLDELPYLLEEDEGFSADLQRAWDRELEGAPVLLICIGSDVRMMDALVGERSPLHGRPTREMRIAPLDPGAVAQITGAADAAGAFDRYLIVGGFPLLAAMWPEGAGLREFLEETLRDDQSPIATTALRIIASEFEQELKATEVLRAIGHGETSYSRIQSRSGVKGNTLTGALDVLVETKGLVAKQLPYAVPRAKSTARYTVIDPYLRFWLRFVGPHMAELSRGRPDLVVGRILRDWSAYRGRAIEPLVREALERLLVDSDWSERLGGARHVESWWRRDHSVEVDLVGGDRPDDPRRIGFLGSIKWHESAPFTAADATALVRDAALVPGAGAGPGETGERSPGTGGALRPKLIAVSRSGFDPADLSVDAALGPEDLLAAW